MKQKRLLAAAVAGALMLTAVGANHMADVQAAVTVPEPVLSLDFEDGDLKGAEAVGKTRAAYGGSIEYDTGYNDGKGLKLGSYGLELNQENLGENHTLSFWIKRTGAIGDYSSLIYMGAPVEAEKENWVSVAGMEGDGSHVFAWTNGDGFGWSTGFSGIEIPQDEWTFITVAQSGKDLDFYVDGELAGEMQAARSLSGEKNDICIGVNNWDDIFPGIIDNVQVYDKALNEDQVYTLYNPDAEAEDILQEKDFTVADSLKIFEGDTGRINMQLPAGVAEEDVQISYSTSNSAAATVDSSGIVTGAAEGSAQISTTVTSGSYSKTLQTDVTVQKRLNDENVVVSYDMSSLSQGKLEDISGLGHDADIRGGASLTEDGERDVLELSGSQYVELPIGIYDSLTDKEAFTIEVTYSRSSTSGTNAWLYCFGSNVQSTGNNYLFFCPNFGGTIRSGIKDAFNERLFTTTVSQNTDEYYTVDMVFDHGVITMYQDGVEVGTALNTGYNMENIVKDGTKDNILGFIGKSCWSADGYFNGKIDSFKIFNKAMSASEVQLSNPAYLEGLQADLDAAVTEEAILGEKNESLDEVRYNLSLPTTMGDLSIDWSCEPAGIVAADGTVYNAEEDCTVTLTASVTSGVLTASKDFAVTVKALDLSRLEELLEQAGNIDEALFTEESLTAFKDAIDAFSLEDVKTQSQADDMIAKINQAVSLLKYKENYAEPWDIVNAAAPKEDAACDAGHTETLFAVPAEVKDAVVVTYSSDNEEVAVYDADENGNGVMTAKAAGTAILTVRVEAKSDGYALEYATVVTVGKDPSQPGGDDGKDPVQPGGDDGKDPAQPGGDDSQTTGGGQASAGSAAGGKSPQTGDNTALLPWAGMTAAALAAAGYMAARRKRGRNSL